LPLFSFFFSFLFLFLSKSQPSDVAMSEFSLQAASSREARYLVVVSSTARIPSPLF